MDLSRRSFLQAMTIGGGVVSAGCSRSVISNARTDQSPDGSSNSTRTSSASPLMREWKGDFSRNCGNNSMPHDSVIEVDNATAELKDECQVIHMSDLTSEEKDILTTVTEKGGYGTCDPSNAFHQFSSRVEKSELCLEYKGIYYNLSIRQNDVIYVS